MEGPIEFQPTFSNVNYYETTQSLEVLKEVTLIQKRPQKLSDVYGKVH